jgi:hypothetical protein
VVHHLRTFGCIIYVRNMMPHLKKMEDRDCKMIFISYESGSKAYRAYDPVGTLKTGYPCIQALSQDNEQGVHQRTVTQAVALDHTSLHRWALEPSRVPWPRTSPPCRGELRCSHVSHGHGPCFLAELSSGAATCSLASGSASLRGGLRRCHVSHGSGLCLLERRAPTPPCVPQLRTSPPYRGGLRCCHVAPASPPREESSGAATYPTAPSGLWTTEIKKCLAAPGT